MNPPVGSRRFARPTTAPRRWLTSSLLHDALTKGMRRFLIGTLLALTILILGIYVVGQRVARQQALAEAADRAERLSETLGGLVTDGVRRGEPGALAPLHHVLETRFAEGYLWRAKIWDDDGTILWSDQEELIGRQFAFSPEEAALLGTSDVHAELSDLQGSEHALERAAGEMLEVYAGAFDASGGPLLVEVYVSTEHMRSYQKAIITAFIPLGIGGLVVFQLAVLPLAVSLGRRVRRTEELRARWSDQALQASELERKRIAQELHDGVVQDLAAVGFSLPGVRRSLLESRDVEDAAATVQQLEDIVRRDISALRSMMIDVYPPDLETTGVVDAIAELVTADRVRGIDVRLSVVGDLHVPTDCARLLYRVAREGLHNVVKHAQAEHVAVTLERRPGAVAAWVCDDGVGAGAPKAAAGESLGLRLLTESVEDAGGTLVLRDGLGEGTRPGTCLEVVLPLPSPRWTAVQDSSKARLAWLSRIPRQREAGTARSRGAATGRDSTV